MTMSKLLEGKRGEEIAVLYLRRLGFQIVDRNFRIRGGEIDIIAIDPSTGSGQDVLVFIEVKTRSSAQFGTPLEAIGYYKIKTLIRAAQFYKVKHPKLPDAMRIDGLGILLDEFGEATIDYVKDISS